MADGVDFRKLDEWREANKGRAEEMITGFLASSAPLEDDEIMRVLVLALDEIDTLKEQIRTLEARLESVDPQGIADRD